MSQAQEFHQMDTFTHQHLMTWIQGKFIAEDQEPAYRAIRDFLQDYPELVDEGRSWTEIHTLATR